jgi:hypothetical protein
MGRNEKLAGIKRRATIKKANQWGIIFFVNVALTVTEYPLFFAPEVVQLRRKHEIIWEVSSAA